jgi:hypothetical protein
LREQIGGRLPVAIGHRVVHGGPEYNEPTTVSPSVLRKLEMLAPLAPLHQPNNLAPIRVILDRQPSLFQVACFDIAFHRGHPQIADRYAILEPLYAEGVRRYGFHGLCCVRRKTPGRSIACNCQRSARGCTPRQRRVHVRHVNWAQLTSCFHLQGFPCNQMRSSWV